MSLESRRRRRILGKVRQLRSATRQRELVGQRASRVEGEHVISGIEPKVTICICSGKSAEGDGQPSSRSPSRCDALKSSIGDEGLVGVGGGTVLATGEQQRHVVRRHYSRTNRCLSQRNEEYFDSPLPVLVTSMARVSKAAVSM